MQTFLILSLVTAALCAPTAHEKSIKVPVTRKALLTRANGDIEPAKYLGVLQRTLQKYGKDVQLPNKLMFCGANEPLKDKSQDGLDIFYYGNIVVGVQGPQTFTCDFDTGSADLFVPGPQCDAAAGCTGTTKYDQQGVDEGNTTSVTYGSGMVSGENSFDSITVAGLTAKRQNVISLTNAQGFSTSASSSLMGLAFSTIAKSGQPTYFENLIEQSVVSKNEFAFYLGRAADGTGDASELTQGGRNPGKFTGAVTKVPVKTRVYWRVQLDKVVVNGKSAVLGALGLDPTRGDAAIDTGTSLLVAPAAAPLSIYSRIPGSLPIQLLEGAGGPTVFAFPCSAKPHVALTFAWTNFAVNPQDFNIGRLTPDFGEVVGNNTLSAILNRESYCLVAIAGEDLDPGSYLYVVGDTFLKNWYSVYSYDSAASVSFAKAV
ncbi:uncharacterized protein LTR77_001920 [Saxophila tyrrhenica]|uniref:Peptidase A1 domain-containing protein n=1 Tax=Saxophila tyrrhenica TaxID=1690608 RepID=A0AAV9PHL3_9PEZI|nr:hypothetical protein LTR77_001920 [Saxophila tyrrhenica]